jgi:hypothetical protein
MDLHMIFSNRQDTGGGRDRSVTAENSVSVLGKGKKFISFPKLLDRILGTQSFNEQGKVLHWERSGREQR